MALSKMDKQEVIFAVEKALDFLMDNDEKAYKKLILEICGEEEVEPAPNA